MALRTLTTYLPPFADRPVAHRPGDVSLVVTDFYAPKSEVEVSLVLMRFL